MAKEKEEDIQKTLQEIRETHKRMKELVIQQEELQKEIEKRDKEKWISENPEYQETYKMIELAKKAEAGEATEEQREILPQWVEKPLERFLFLEESDDDTDREGNNSDEYSSSKEGKAKEGKASESQSSSTSSSASSLSGSASSSTSTALPEEIINLASIREVYSKFKAKGDDWDTDDEAFGLQDKYFQYLDILRRKLKDREKIEKILEEFYQDCASNELAETDFWDIIYQTNNEDLIMLSLLNLAARKVKDDFLEVIKIPAHSDIEIYFKAFLKIQNEGKFNQITLNESIKNQQDNLLSVMDQVVKALSISIDSQEDENSDDDASDGGHTSDEDFSGKEGKVSESQFSSTSSSVSSLVESTVSEVTIGSILPEIAAIPDTGGFSELAGDSTETGDHLAG